MDFFGYSGEARKSAVGGKSKGERKRLVIDMIFRSSSIGKSSRVGGAMLGCWYQVIYSFIGIKLVCLVRPKESAS